jgi:NIPSNAP
MDVLRAGPIGPVFEVRTYQLKGQGLAPTIALWDKVVKTRIKLSPLVAVMYSVGAIVPHFIHIWPYATLNERMRLRATAAEQGLWPPVDGLAHVESMQSEIFLPARFSPLR